MRPEEQEHWRPSWHCNPFQSRRGLAFQTEKINILSDPDGHRRAWVFAQFRFKHRYCLGPLTSGGQNLPLDFDGCAQGERQIRLAVERPLPELLLRLLKGFLSILVRKVVFLPRQRVSAQPTKSQN